jgi:hypothetical protein
MTGFDALLWNTGTTLAILGWKVKYSGTWVFSKIHKNAFFPKFNYGTTRKCPSKKLSQLIRFFEIFGAPIPLSLRDRIHHFWNPTYRPPTSTSVR